MLGENFRLKAGVAVPGNFDGQFTKVTFERFLAFAVAGVTRWVGNGLIFGVTQVVGHFGFKGSLHQLFSELLRCQ